VPRQCVFVGTTNESAFLKDVTGGRRFWPVTCGAKIETEALARDREQLFAEALATFNAGETWHLTPEMERQAGIEQEAAREEHPWEGPIKGFLDGDDTLERLPRDRVTVSEVLSYLGIPMAQHTSGNARQVGSILRLLGWKCSHTKAGNAWERQ
jgi:putative DNA primase/helicase